MGSARKRLDVRALKDEGEGANSEVILECLKNVRGSSVLENVR